MAAADDGAVLGSLNATLAKKKAEKYDPELEKDIRSWLSTFMDKPEAGDESIPLQVTLKNGSLLCELLNKLAPGAVKRVNSSALAFKQMENISNYLTACGRLGLSEGDRFQTTDLFEDKDMLPVLTHLRVLKLLAERNKNTLSHLLAEGASVPKPHSPAPSKRASWSFRNAAAKKETPDAAAVLRSRAGSQLKAPQGAADVSSLEDDVKTKEEFKYSPELEQGAKVWIRALLEDEKLFSTGSFGSGLKSGEVLLQIMNKLVPGSVGKINHSKFGFAQMENIGNYLKACVSQLGLKKTDLFDTPDLYDEKAMNLVINHIHVLAHHVEKRPDYTGPKIGNFSQVRTLYSASLGEANLDDIIGSEKSEAEEATLSEIEQELVDWVNSWVERQNEKKYSIKKLGCRGVQSGVVLLKLCEALTKCEVGPYEENPTILWHCMQNASLIRRFIFQQTFIAVETRPQDIILGNVSKIIDLLSFLRDKFDIDYLFLKLLNEGQETKLSLQDVDNRMGSPKTAVTPTRESEAFSDDEEEEDDEEAVEERKRREAEIITLREEAEKAKMEEERARAERAKLEEERRKREEEERLQAEREEAEELARLERVEIEKLEAELRAKDEEEKRQREEEEERERQEEERKRAAAEALAAREREEEEKQRAEAARAEEERQARESAESKAKEEAEKARLEELRKKREEEELAEKELAEQLEKERLERIQKALEEAERLERERAEKELSEQMALAAQKAEEEAELRAKQEAERKARQEAERQAREEAERKAREEAKRKAKEEAERKAKEEAERKAREEEERKAKEEAERRAKEEAERRAKEEATRKAHEEAERVERERLEAERKRLEEEEARLAEQRRQEAAERKRREEERKAREEAERLEAERRAREAAQRAKEAKAEADREAARQEAERLAREEEERLRKARDEAAKREREEAERKAREEAELKARQEALRKAREEAERKARQEAERKAREEAERKARQEAERKARQEAERKARELAARKAREEAERKAREEEERKAREAAEKKAKEEAERRAKEEALRKAKEEEERKAKEEAERKAKEEAERVMQERIRKAKEEARRKEEERYAKEEAARKQRELEERRKRLAEAEAEERALLKRMQEAAQKKKLEEEERARAEEERKRKVEEERKAKEEAARQALEEERRAKEEAAKKRLEEKAAKLALVKLERKAQEERIAALRAMAMEKAKERAAQRVALDKERKDKEREEEEARAAALAKEESEKRAKAEADRLKLEQLEKKQAAEAEERQKRRAARKERREARKQHEGDAPETLSPAAGAVRADRPKSMWVNKIVETPDKRRSLVLQNDGTKERIVRAQNTVRKRVATELLETEKNYVKNMEQVIQLLVGPVLNASKQGMRIMKDSEFFSCFANLPQLTAHHASFCAKLTERIENNWTDEVTIGDIFIEASANGMFEDYKPYLVNYSVAIVAVQSMVQKYDRFKHVVEFFERAQLQGSKLNLESFLIMPVQRMPRYILLMRDMLKYTHTHHPDKVLLEKALEAVSATMTSHNKEIDPKASDHAHKLLAVAGSIMNVDVLQQEKGITGGGLIIPKRRWIKEGEISVKVKSKKGGKGMRPGTISCKSLGIDTGNKKPKTYCFLFNDMLIHCEQIPQLKGQTGKEQERPFVFTAALPLVEVVEVETDPKDSKSFSVTLINTSRWIFKADSKESREQWEGLVREQVAAVNA